jgi:hypothetical protein
MALVAGMDIRAEREKNGLSNKASIMTGRARGRSCVSFNLPPQSLTMWDRIFDGAAMKKAMLGNVLGDV